MSSIKFLQIDPKTNNGIGSSYGTSVAEPGAGAAGTATFRAAPEQEQIFLLVGAGSQSRTY